MFNHCDAHMIDLFRNEKLAQAIDTTFLTQHTLTPGMLAVFGAVVLLIVISLCLSCGDSKDQLNKRKEKRKNQIKNGSDVTPNRNKW